LAVGGPEKPIQVDDRCADCRQGEVDAIATGDNKEQQSKEEVTMIVHSDTRIDPQHPYTNNSASFLCELKTGHCPHYGKKH